MGKRAVRRTKFRLEGELMLVKAINLAIAFFTLNKGVKANAKSIVSEAMDIGVAISKIAKKHLVIFWSNSQYVTDTTFQKLSTI